MISDRKHRYDASANKIVKAYTIKEIFRDNWDEFVRAMAKQGKTIRPTIMEEVAKIIGCQDPMNGFALYSCPDCGIQKRVPFTCKSRFCNTCAQNIPKTGLWLCQEPYSKHHTDTLYSPLPNPLDHISKKTALCLTFFLKRRLKPLNIAFMSPINLKNTFRA